MIGISIFDVDRTLTRAPTYSAFLIFAARARAPWRLGLIPMLAPWALAYALKLLPRRGMKEAMHRAMMGGALPRAVADDLAGRFAQSLIERGLYDQGRALVRDAQASGRRVVLATAAPELYIAPLADALAADDVVASRGRWDGDRLTHRIDGDNCYGAAKLRMIEAQLAAADIARDRAHIRFYSDHASDLPTFEWADEPVAVNPSKRLRAIAAERGWPVLDWARPAAPAPESH